MDSPNSHGQIKRASLGWTAFPFVPEGLDLERGVRNHDEPRTNAKKSKGKPEKEEKAGPAEEGTAKNPEKLERDAKADEAGDGAMEGEASGDAEHHHSSGSESSSEDDDDDEEVFTSQFLCEGSPRALVAFQAHPVPTIIDKVLPSFFTAPEEMSFSFVQICTAFF